MPTHLRVPRAHSCFPEARAFPLRLPQVTGIGGKGSSKCATLCNKDRAPRDLGAEAAGEDLAAEAEELGVAEVDSVGEEDSGAEEDSVAGEEGLEVVEIGPEDGRE